MMKSKPKKTTKPKPKARKRTSSRVSSAAGRLMELVERKCRFIAVEDVGAGSYFHGVDALVKMVAASALSQDEKGKR